jgi:hypothetical protein
MKQLKFLPLSIRILIYFIHACGIVMLATLREMLWVAKVLPAPNVLTDDQINRIYVISTYSYLYKFHLILTIYVLNSVNALIFDSCTVFPLGWVLAGIISLILEKSTDMFHTRIARMFRRPVTNIDYYSILYNSWVVAGVLTGFGFGVPITWTFIIKQN